MNRGSSATPWRDRVSRRLRRTIGKTANAPDGVAEGHLAAVRENDAEENRASEPPEEEKVELHCVCLAECYGPSHFGALISGIRRLGWDEQGNSRLTPGRLTGWVESARSENPGSIELDHVVRPGDNRWTMGQREADLPDVVDYARGRLECLFPGLLVLSMQFVLKDEAALSLDRALREEYETISEPIHRGTAYLTPANRKQRAVEEERAGLRRECASWFSANVPGAFHGGGSSGEDFPSCELLIVERARPFMHPPEEETPTPMRLIHNYMRLLRLDDVWNSYESTSLPGLLLRLPTTGGEGVALLLAGRKSSLLEHPGYRLRGEREPERVRIADALDMIADGVVLVWGLHALLRRYEHALAALRDRAAKIDLTEPEVAAVAIASLQSDLFTLSRDVVPLSSGLERLADDGRYLRYRAGRFTRALAPPAEGSDEEPAALPSQRPPSFGERARGLLARMSPRTRPPEGPEAPGLPREREDLLDNVTSSIARRSSRLRDAEEDLRQLTTAIGSSVYAVVQERTNRSNLRLQRIVAVLTAVTVLLAIVTAADSCAQEPSEPPTFPPAGPQDTSPSESGGG